MRVIGGVLGGRSLAAPAGAATRPTTDRVREALFAVLGDLTAARVADLFAGSGALGIEALSRGAGHACFVERAGAACRVIAKNLESLGLGDRAQLWRGDVARSRRFLCEAAPFDLVFCDPPWGQLDQAIHGLERMPWDELLSEGGRLCLEHPGREQMECALPPLNLERVRRWGDTAVTIWARKTGSDEPREGA